VPRIWISYEISPSIRGRTYGSGEGSLHARPTPAACSPGVRAVLQGTAGGSDQIEATDRRIRSISQILTKNQCMTYAKPVFWSRHGFDVAWTEAIDHNWHGLHDESAHIHGGNRVQPGFRTG